MTIQAAKGSWLYRLRWPLLLAAFGGYAFLHGRYEAYHQEQNYNEQAQKAKHFLESSDSIRRRAGLWPIDSRFPERRYEPDFIDSSKREVTLVGTPIPFKVFPSLKVVDYDPVRGALLWETESIESPARKQDGLPIYSLTRRYSYEAAKLGKQPWRFMLYFVLNDVERSSALNPAQADSVLRDWRAHGVRDSLAAAKNSVSHKPLSRP